MDLEIEGCHALLFDDDAQLAFVNSRSALGSLSIDPCSLSTIAGRGQSTILASETSSSFCSHMNSVITIGHSIGERTQEGTCRTTLAVDDGSNNVGMIQEADLGVGISGVEGMQTWLSRDAF